MGSKEDGQTRIVVLWDRQGIKVQSTADNPSTIAALEMAKALMLQQTIGPGRRYQAGEAQMAQAPAIYVRKVDAQK